MSNQIIKVFVGIKPSTHPSIRSHAAISNILEGYGTVGFILPPKAFYSAYKLISRCAYEITFNEINNRLKAGIEIDTPYVVVMENGNQAEAHFSFSISEEKKAELLQNISDFQPNV